jgi:hypothetical protein
MNYSKGGKHAHAGVVKDHMPFGGVAWQGRCVLLAHVKTSKRKRYWSNINLIAMIEATKVQFFK